MNEKLAKVGDQLKDATKKLNETWKAMEAARKKRIIAIAVAVLVLAVGLVIVTSVVNSRWVTLYEGMPQDEMIMARAALEEQAVKARIDGANLQVASKQVDLAVGYLAMQGIPSSSPGYDWLDKASGLTTTELEKLEWRKVQWQERLQSIIRTFEGVRNASVTLNIDTDSNRAWDSNRKQSSAAVTIALKPGYVLQPTQVTGIRYLVGSSTGIDPNQVSIMDNSGSILAAQGSSADLGGARMAEYLERLDFEDEVARRMKNKADEQMSLLYPDASLYRITAQAKMDWDAMLTEMKEYYPLEGTNHGVIDEMERRAISGFNDYAQGVVGETDNTDVPIYLDRNGDGQGDYVDFEDFYDYAVSYTLKQIEKDGAHLQNASISIFVDDATMDNQKKQSIRNGISKATGITLENVVVENYVITAPAPPLPPVTWIQLITDTFGIPAMVVYIAIGVLFLLIVVLILVLVLRSKAKKKRKAADEAALIAEKEEAERVQREIEERKKQLKTAAVVDEAENAITNEVREFARNNPEIAAGLLRNWLRDE